MPSRNQILIFVVGFFVFSLTATADSASDAERIRLLEEQLQRTQEIMEQQQQLLESVQEELRQIRSVQETTDAMAADTETDGRFVRNCRGLQHAGRRQTVQIFWQFHGDLRIRPDGHDL